VTEPAAGRRILFVEDEPGLRQAYQRYFARRFVVAMAETGAEARSQFDAFAPDLVVLDLKLPDADGMDVLRALRQRRSDFKVIITTSYASQQPVFEMLGIPHNGYLVKPFTLGDLEAQIVAALG
jgi:DNA-binding response OmpR family regulator